jgi:hypothetical protein
MKQKEFDEETVYIKVIKSEGELIVTEVFGSECMVQNFSQIKSALTCMSIRSIAKLPDMFDLIIDFAIQRKTLPAREWENRIELFKRNHEIQDVYQITNVIWSANPVIICGPSPDATPILTLPLLPIDKLTTKN